MKGTSLLQMLEMFCRPPTTIKAAEPMITKVTTTLETSKFAVMTLVIALVCTADPMPKMVKQANTLNQMAANLAHQGTLPSGLLKRCSHTCMAPPIISPLESITRCFMEMNTSVYLVAMPSTPVSHIHSTAPGPPERMAVATPTMEPVPKVEASEVTMAPKFDTSPFALSSDETESFRASGSLR